MRTMSMSMAVYILIGALYLIATVMGADNLTFYIKPLLLLPLMYCVLRSSFPYKSVLVTALGFCWMGDVLLLFAADHAAFFMGGLCAFLTGHVLYIWLFLKLIKSAGNTVVVKYPVAAVLLFYIALFYILIGSSLGAMMWPVMIYAFVISGMLYLAILLSQEKSFLSSFFLVAGSASFVISDTILAINKFYTPLPFSGLLIMSTYIFAQAAIIWSLISRQPGFKRMATSLS